MNFDSDKEIEEKEPVSKIKTSQEKKFIIRKSFSPKREKS
jgi:hypothetical protein